MPPLPFHRSLRRHRCHRHCHRAQLARRIIHICPCLFVSRRLNVPSPFGVRGGLLGVAGPSPHSSQSHLGNLGDFKYVVAEWRVFKHPSLPTLSAGSQHRPSRQAR